MKDQSTSVFTFQFKNSTYHEVRTIQKADGSVWFVNVDVCKTLDIKNPRHAIKMLEDDEKGVVKTDTLGGKQGLTIISESGLYSLIMRSRKPQAKKFRKWVTSEVLPQIRKTGAYIQEPTRRDAISPLAVASFLQATMDTFWNIEKALVEYEAVKDNLKKARRDTSIVIRSIRKAFPLASENCNLLGDFDKIPLEIEMR
mgnify:CR=1 FL=1